MGRFILPFILTLFFVAIVASYLFVSIRASVEPEVEERVAWAGTDDAFYCQAETDSETCADLETRRQLRRGKTTDTTEPPAGDFCTENENCSEPSSEESDGEKRNYRGGVFAGDTYYGEESYGDTSWVGELLPNDEAANAPAPPPKRNTAAQLQSCYADGNCRSARVWFGSNRAIDFSLPLADVNDNRPSTRTPFAAENGEALSLGVIDVSIPAAGTPHDAGEIEARHVGHRLDPLQHIILYDFERLDEAAFGAQLAPMKSAFIFVHGYNTPLKAAAMKAAQIKIESGFPGEAMIFSWPSTHPIRTPLASEYTASLQNAEASRKYFLEFLQLLRAQTDAAVIHIVTHSTGGVVALDALTAIHEQERSEAPLFGELMMIAPDLGKETFLRKMARNDGLFSGVTLYASRADLAMAAAQKACERAQAGPCPQLAGEIPPAPKGPATDTTFDTIDVTNIKGDFFSIETGANFSHTRYAGDKHLVEDVGRLLRTGDHPPDTRSRKLRRIGDPPHHYWQFP